MPRRAVVLAVSVVTLVAAAPSCGSDAADYEEGVLGIERSLQEGLRGRAGTSELEAARETLRLVEQALEAARDLDPPPGLERGHALLIRYYEASVEFSSLDVERLRLEAEGRDTASVEAAMSERYDELLRLLGEVLDALPFFDPEPVP